MPVTMYNMFFLPFVSNTFPKRSRVPLRRLRAFSIVPCMLSRNEFWRSASSWISFVICNLPQTQTRILRRWFPGRQRYVLLCFPGRQRYPNVCCRLTATLHTRCMLYTLTGCKLREITWQKMRILLDLSIGRVQGLHSLQGIFATSKFTLICCTHATIQQFRCKGQTK